MAEQWVSLKSQMLMFKTLIKFSREPSYPKMSTNVYARILWYDFSESDETEDCGGVVLRMCGVALTIATTEF